MGLQNSLFFTIHLILLSMNIYRDSIPNWGKPSCQIGAIVAGLRVADIRWTAKCSDLAIRGPVRIWCECPQCARSRSLARSRVG